MNPVNTECMRTLSIISTTAAIVLAVPLAAAADQFRTYSLLSVPVSLPQIARISITFPLLSSARRAVATIPASTPAPSIASQPLLPLVAFAATEGSFASQVEASVFSLTNRERAHEGIAALTSDTRVAQIARTHSADMIARDYFSHTNTVGCDATCRADKSGYAWHVYGENIHMMRGYQLGAEETAKKILTDWMNSPAHRANILNGDFTHVGIGVVVEGNEIYSSANYSLPR